MPFYKAHELPREFFNLFLSKATEKTISGDSRLHPMLPIPLLTGESEDFMVRYFNRSGESGTEDLMEYFPCIVIQDFQPELDRSRLWGKDYIEGYFHEATSVREIIDLPIPLKQNFQVSVVTRRLKEIQGSQDWFYQNFKFNRPDWFLFNQFSTEEGIIGDVVPYRVEMQNVQRDDNRFENSYMFTVDSYLHARYKNYSIDNEVITGGNFDDAIGKLRLRLNVMDLEGYKEMVYENFLVPEGFNL